MAGPNRQITKWEEYGASKGMRSALTGGEAGNVLITNGSS